MGRMQWDIDRFSAIESHRRKILVKEGFEHNNLISLFQKCSEDGILTWKTYLGIGLVGR